MAAQPCYIQLGDATGLPLPPAQLAELEAAACELRAAFPAEFQNDFAVYDFGFYLHQERYEGGVPGVFQAKVAEVSSQSGAYLLFGHEVSRDGGSVRLWASFSFASEDYECLDAGVLDAAIKGMAGGQGDRAAAHAKKLEILASLSARLTEGFCCSAYYSSQEGRDGSGRPGLRSSGSGEACVDFEKVDAAAQALLNDEVYIAFLDKIVAIAAFYQNCVSQQWRPGAKDGIIPKCVWENTPVSIPYTYLDLPFYCGATDGLYSEVKGLADFLLSLDDFASELSKVICSYTVWYLACEKGQGELNQTEFNLLMDYLRDASWLSPQMASVFSGAYNLLKRGASGVMWIAGWDCEALEKTRNTIEKLYEAITQKETWVGIYRGMIEQALGIVDNVSGFSNEERYYQGYYGAKVAINFLPGLALTKSKYLNGLSGFLDNLSARVSNNSPSYGFKLKRALFDSRKARLKAQAPIKNWPESKQTQFFNDFPDYDKLKKVDKEGVIRAWEKLFKQGDAVSDALRKNPDVLNWFSQQSPSISQSTANNLLSNLSGKTVKDAVQDAHGRMVVTTESSNAVRVVATVEKTASGEFKSFKYVNAYNKHTQLGKPPLSTNKLAPDFSGNPSWLYPVTGNQKNIVKIELSGKRKGTDGDFHRANQEAGFSGTTAPQGYTWHHLDDFNPITGESTMQLVKTVHHQSTVPHTGSVKQFENYHNTQYVD